MAKALVLVRNDVNHDARVLRTARVLRDMGYEVLVAGVVSREERETKLEVDGIRVIRLVGPLRLARRLVRRPSPTDADHPPAKGDSARRTGMTNGEHRLRRLLVTLAFNLQGAVLAWRTAPDLVHANDYDTMWIGAAAKLLRGSRLVYDAHELWPDQDGDIGWRPWLIACEWLFVRLADATTTVSPGCAEAMAARYHVGLPVVVRNLPEPPLRAEPRRSDGPRAVYVGVIAPHRGLEEAIAALAVVPGLRLRLVGADSNGFAAQLRERAEMIGVADRVDVWPAVPPSKVAEAIADSDLGIVLIQPTSLSHRMSLPNKLFEYTAAGVPVLASELPVMGPLVREEGIGEVVPPGDVDAIAAAMRRLIDPVRNAAVRERVRSFGERVNWRDERRVLEEVYAGLQPHPPAGSGTTEAEPGGSPLTIVAVGAGSSTHVARFVQWFAERGHRVFLFSDSPNPSGIAGVEQHVPPVRRWILRVPRPLRGALYHGLSALDLLRALRASRPDVVHVYYAYSYYAWVAAVLGCRPLVVTTMGGDVLFDEQGSPGPIGKWLTTRLLQRADYITTQSDFLGDAVSRLGASRTKIERILWGVSPEAFCRRDASDLRLALGLAPGARIILSPKILQPFYRVHLVVEAMAIVRRSIPDAVLVVSEYGSDPVYREQIARRIEELDLSENVLFVGQIPYEEMPSYYSLAQVSVGIPSSDSMPQSLFEAMACGTPTILSRLPRYEEIVQHEESAYFVDPDPEAIAAGIVHILDDTALRNRIAERGRRIVVEQADLDKEAARVEARYRELSTTIRPRAFSLAALLSAGFAAARAYLDARATR